MAPPSKFDKLAPEPSFSDPLNHGCPTYGPGPLAARQRFFGGLRPKNNFLNPSILTKRPLGEVEARQVESFGARLLAADDQLSSVAAAETLVVRLLALRPPLPVLALQPLAFGIGRLTVGVLPIEDRKRMPR